MIYNDEILPEFNLNIRLLSKTGSKLKCCIYNKRVYYCTPYRQNDVNETNANPPVTIKLREDLT